MLLHPCRNGARVLRSFILVWTDLKKGDAELESLVFADTLEFSWIQLRQHLVPVVKFPSEEVTNWA